MTTHVQESVEAVCPTNPPIIGGSHCSGRR